LRPLGIITRYKRGKAPSGTIGIPTCVWYCCRRMPVKCQRIQGLPCNILGTGNLNEKIPTCIYYLPMQTPMESEERKNAFRSFYFLFQTYNGIVVYIPNNPPQYFFIVILYVCIFLIKNQQIEKWQVDSDRKKKKWSCQIWSWLITTKILP